MTHTHGGCSPALQIIIVVFGSISVCLGIYALDYDYNWNQDLDTIQRSFNPIEYKLLKRDMYWLEATFVLIVGVCAILVFVHLVISLKRRKTDDLYGTRVSKIFHIVVLIANVVAFVLMLISVLHYDSNYYKVEEQDTRVYTYEFIHHGQAVELPSPHSLFYYCHLGHGHLMHPSELKGIRIKKSDTKLCQHLGAKLLASVLALYISILCYCVQWFITVSDRYLDGTAIATLFELYGDAEEFTRDHQHHPDPATEVSEFRKQHKFRKMRDVDEIRDSKFEEEFGEVVVDVELPPSGAGQSEDGQAVEDGKQGPMQPQPQASKSRRAALRLQSIPL